MQPLLLNIYHSYREQYRLRLIAGADGLSSPISWLYYTEDIGNISFLRGKELVITTGMMIRSDPNWLYKLIEELAFSSCSGLIINIGNYIKADSISPEILALCDRHDFPLFTMPWQIHIVDIMQDICNQIFMNTYQENTITRLFSDIMTDSAYPMEKYTELESYGFPERAQYTVLLFGNAVSIIHIQNHLDSLQIKYCLFLKKDKIVLIAQNCAREIIQNFLNLLLANNRFRQRQNSQVSHPRIGIGETVHSLMHVRYSYENAVVALDAAVQQNKDYLFFQDFGIHRILYSVTNKEILHHIYEESLGILERFDAENKTQLLETLHIYFQCQKSILDTANTMFTHRNTISYRLKKIQALLPLSLDEPEDTLMLQMAFQIRSIK